MNAYEKWYKSFSKSLGLYDSDEMYTSLRSMLTSGKNTFSLNRKMMEKSVDVAWVEAIEEGLKHVDTVLRNPSRTIEDVETIVPIALSRKITVESVKHLAQHTNLIQDFDPVTKKVTPSKVLNTYKEDSMMTYENKFVNTLIDRLYIFVNRRYDKLKEVTNDEAIYSMDYETVLGEDTPNKMTLKLRLETVDSLEQVDASGATMWQRIDKIKRTVESYKGSQFCMSMGNAYIRPPVMRTNAIMKNVDLKACHILWQFIESYDKIGYELNVSDTAEKPDDSLINDIYAISAVSLLLFRTYTSGEDKAELKTKVSRPVSPKIVRKFDTESPPDYDMEVLAGAFEKAPEQDYTPFKRLPEDAEQMVHEINTIIQTEINYFEELHQRKLEEQRLEEEREQKRREEERRKEQEAIAAAIRAEQEALEKERLEREEKERQLKEMLEKQRLEQEQREREEREERERREQERIEKERKEQEERERQERIERERIEKELREMSEEERQRREQQKREEEQRRAAETAARLEREKHDRERAQHLRKDRQLLEQKPFKQIYYEYSTNPFIVLRRHTVKFLKNIGLIKPKELTELEKGIQEIEMRCQAFADAENAEIQRKKDEEWAERDRMDSYSSNSLIIFRRDMRRKIRKISDFFHGRKR